MKRRPISHRAKRHFESLEDRRLLTAADITDLSPVLENAFETASDLSNYTQEQLETADRWVVATRHPAIKVELADTLGVTVDEISDAGLIENTYFVDTSNYDSTEGRPPFSARVDSLLYGYPLVGKERSLRFVADDPLFDQQWNLHNAGQVSPDATFDHGFVEAWENLTGEGIVISIVDEGVELTHPDLSENVVAGASYDFATNDANPEPAHAFASHGTAVAGIAAARGGNGVGITGAAPGASLAAVKLPFSDQTDQLESQAVAHASSTVDIYNHSWGPNDDGVAAGPGPLFVAAIEQSIREGRGGLGSIHVWAAGNGQLAQDDVNLDGYANLRYTIATAAIDAAGRQTSYSEPGAALFVSAISGSRGNNIVSTDLVGDRGLNAFADATDGDALSDLDYTSNFGGTSAAAPVVSGAIALMLEANPNLTWRDVQHILASTAMKNDPQDSSWHTNAAGFSVNEKYGFGALDAKAAVDLAATWTNVGPELRVAGGQPISRSIADGSEVTVPININRQLDVEWVEVTLEAQHSRRGDLEVILTSPSGTESVLASPRDTDDGRYSNWVFTSARNWGESSAGTWLVSVRDAVTGEVGEIQNVRVDVFGTASESDGNSGGGNTGGNDNGNTGSNGGGDTGGGDTGGGDPGTGSGGGNSGGGGGGTNPPTDEPPAPDPVSSIEGSVRVVDANGTSSSSGSMRNISLYLDMNDDGRVDINEPRVTASANGSFRFDQVPHGDYTVRMTPTAGWVDVTPELQNVNLRSETATTTFAVRSYRDFGDAPFPYATSQADGGAVHAIDDRLFLGSGVDPDAGGAGNSGANSDDVNGTDDEDGIRFDSSIMPGTAGTLTATASESGFLQGWIDFNADGDWDDAGEQIIKNRRVPAGESEQVFIVPSGVLPGITYARFRIANQLNIQPTGMAFDGEVEDYVILVGSDTAQIDAPVAANDTLKVREDSPNNTLRVLANDSLPLSGGQIVSVTGTTRGSISIGPGGGSLEYTPPVAFNGIETFTYTVENLVGDQSTATVNVEVEEVVLPPTAQDDSFSVLRNSNQEPLSILANDSTTNGTLRIQSVSPTSQGGIVQISEDRKSVLYKPRAGYVGPDTFSYTTIDTDGETAEANVSITVNQPVKTVAFELVALDDAGNELTNVRPGDDFTLMAYVTDRRSVPKGSFAAYFDVTYDPAVVDITGDITHGESYNQVLDGSLETAGLIDEVGGTTSETTSLGGGRLLVFSVPMRAIGAGNAGLATNVADVMPAHQVLLFGSNDPVNEQEIDFGSLDLPVRAFTNTAEPLDTNNDGSVSPIDALRIINELNTLGARSVSRMAPVETLPNSFADVNGDGSISPIDALAIINRLNSHVSAEGENPLDAMVSGDSTDFASTSDVAAAIARESAVSELDADSEAKKSKLATIDKVLRETLAFV